MPSIEYTIPVFEISGVMETIWIQIFAAIEGRTAVDYTISLGATDGYRSVLITYNVPGEFGADFAITILFLGLAADEQMPSRMVVGSSGFTKPVYLRGHPPSDPIANFGAAVAFWGTFFVAIAEQILNDWTYGIATTGTVISLESAGGQAGSAAVPISVQTDGECMILPLQMVYVIGTDAAIYTNSFAQPSSAVSAVSASVSIAMPGAERIVEAIQDLAHRDVAVSINDNQAIALLAGGEVLTP